MTDATQNRGVLKEHTNSGRFVRENAELVNLADIMGNAVDVSGALISMNLEHSKIHQGYGWNISIESPSIAAAASYYILFRVVSGVAHLRSYDVSVSEGPAIVRLFESPTITAVGTAVNIRNRNRAASDENGVDVYTEPTVTADGTRLETDFIPSDGNKSGGSAGSFYEEWVLNQTDYILKITNNNNIAITAVINAFWYSSPPIL